MEVQPLRLSTRHRFLGVTQSRYCKSKSRVVGLLDRLVNLRHSCPGYGFHLLCGTVMVLGQKRTKLRMRYWIARRQERLFRRIHDSRYVSDELGLRIAQKKTPPKKPHTPRNTQKKSKMLMAIYLA